MKALNACIRMAAASLVLHGVLVLTACATRAPYPPAPQEVQSPDLPYRIGPLDTVNIVVWRNPDLSSTVTVRPDGLVSIPLAEDVQAAGRSPAQLSRELEKALAKYVRDPVVTVVVTGFQGVYSDQVRIVGEAAKPQAVPYRRNMTILDVMIQERQAYRVPVGDLVLRPVGKITGGNMRMDLWNAEVTGTLKTYAGLPHGMMSTEPDLINRDILSFIRDDAQNTDGRLAA